MKITKRVLSFLSSMLCILILVALAGCGNSASLPTSASSVQSDSFVEMGPHPMVNTATFSAVGDNLIHTSLYLQAGERAGGNGYDFTYAYENVRYFFENKDINVINQETLVSDEIEPSSYPLFCSPGEVVRETYDVGWNVYTMSNNHVYDKGSNGVASTLRFWESMPKDVVATGLFTNTEDDSGISLQEMNGIIFAYVAFAENTNGIPQPSDTPARVILTSEEALMEHLIRRAEELADIVVVAMHWGVEYSFDITDGQRNLAQKVVNWGADLIIGTHPHVIQPVEWVTNELTGKNVLVAYSMGNFISAQANARNMIGLVLSMTFSQIVNSDGSKEEIQITDINVHPSVTHYDSAYTNVRVYLYRDYNAELAAQHGCQERDGYGTFTTKYITDLVENLISPEFLDLA